MSSLSTAIERYDLPLAEPFGISRGRTETAATVVVRIDDGNATGIGGVAPAEYYGETPASVTDVLPDLLAIVENVGTPHAQQRIARAMQDCAPDAPAARAAVSLAVHDLAASRADEPLYRRWGLDAAATPATSYTIGIDTPEQMAAKATRAREAGYPILKVKVGEQDDRARVEAVREAAPEARLRMDANGAWDTETAIEATRWLADYDVEFLEQPVPAEDVAGLRRVRTDGELPIAADESCLTAGDVPALADAVDIVVVKLAKCGGLRPAVRLIETATAHSLDAMLGCMVASNAAIAGACHLAPLVEYVDLDGALLLAEDPYEGVPMPAGNLDLAAVESGTGVSAAQRR